MKSYAVWVLGGLFVTLGGTLDLDLQSREAKRALVGRKV